MAHALWKTLLIPLIVTLSSSFSSCTAEDPVKLAMRKTVLGLEMKYKRERERNGIDLHFQSPGPDQIVVVLTYKNAPDRPLAESIADAAMELVKRTLREDTVLRYRDIKVEKTVSPR